MMLGEIIYGGVGSGLYGFLLFAIIAVFVAGLMVGRTPEYLGKKIEAKEVKMTMLAILCLPLAMLGFTAVAVVLPGAVAGISASGPHGFTEALYAYVSAAANNGSAFAGLSANTPWWNTSLAFGMLIGRFFVIIPALAIAGSLAAKKTVPPSAGTFPTTGPLFVGLVVGVILIVGGLTFFPALALGPIVEHFAMARRHDVLRSRHDIRHPRHPQCRQPARPGHPAAGARPVVPQARPAPALAQSGDVRRRDRFCPDHHPAGPRRAGRAAGPRLRAADQHLAVVHRAVRQFRRSGRRGARPRPGGDAAAGAHRDAGQTPAAGRGGPV